MDPGPASAVPRLAGRLDLRRPWRDWLGDLGVTAGAAALGLLLLQGTLEDPTPGQKIVVPLDLSVGAASLVFLLLFRRRFPVAVAVTMMVVQWTATSTMGTAAVAMYSLAMLRPWKTLLPIAGANMALIVTLFWATSPLDQFRQGAVVFCLIYAVLITTGMLVRSRRQLIASVEERARAAEEGQRLRVEEARLLERERIAREMHDVLAHRISLLAVHAGALEFRPDAPADQRAAAGIIRQSAYEAMEDLREVIGVLRGGPGGAEADRPQPALADVPDLVRESSAAGARVDLDDRVPDPAKVPVRVGRHAYRIVQEGLTNARKHAPGARVRVTLDAPDGTALTVEIVNPVPPGPPAPALPGAGAGLVGLGERVALLGGTLEHGPTGDGGFRLRARLPLPG
ncbi:sensor histidine kinase [Actinomadura opuntiae]|uniref:sensor histidine kinase n=1 Tax=Actinomadura sp. OS1-43 TaxID=604315 RepID=UPI00255A8707|nr:histidine kinase [Actinomadura sp. OS1-43]MDL4820625.1 histidine kinase [Actinomadura sp. OS1-43]